MRQDLKVEESTLERRTVSPAEYRATAGLFPSGVTVVTRRLPDGRPYGMTVSSFTSVSLEPPLILVCIDQAAAFLESMCKAMPFAVNVLSDQQQRLAKRFSDRHEEDRFANTPWQAGLHSVPLLEGAVAGFVCVEQQTIRAGDHTILIGQVEELHTREGKALVWCQRNYHRLDGLLQQAI